MDNLSVREASFWLFLPKLLPKKLVYFCFIHVMAFSTSGKYGSTVVPDLSGMDALKRYSDDLL